MSGSILTEALLLGTNKSKTWNGDLNFDSLGYNVFDKLLELDQKLIPDKRSLKIRKLTNTTINIFDNYLNNVFNAIEKETIENQQFYYQILFRHLIYQRSIDGIGKGSRLVFYYYWYKLYNKFPEASLNLLSILPEKFGYFKDLINIYNLYQEKNIRDRITLIYSKYLKDDFEQFINFNNFNNPKQFLDDLIKYDNKLKILNNEDLLLEIKKYKLSLVAKWTPREVKKTYSIYKLNDTFRKDLMEKLFNVKLTEKSFGFYNKILRKLLSVLNQLIDTIEVKMTTNNLRQFSSIEPSKVPSKALTKYRKAFLNEKIKEVLLSKDKNTGNRYLTNDRIKTRNNFKKALLENTLKGDKQDLKILAREIFKLAKTNNSSDMEEEILDMQWNKLMESIKEDIKKEDLSIIPVVDVSGSMEGADVLDIAIALGVMTAQISTVKEIFLTFSEEPEIVKLKGSNIVKIFRNIKNSNWGYSTDIDKTYELILDLFVKKSVDKDIKFSILFLTDGQFNQMTKTNSNSYDTFYERMTKRFEEKGYKYLPRTVFWNFNSKSNGFPSQGNTQGLQLVSGFSANILKTVLNEDIEYISNDSKISMAQISPTESFVKTLMTPQFDIIDDIINLYN